jgi:RNA polymerase sigma-B factor
VTAASGPRSSDLPLARAHELYFADRSPALRELLLRRYQGLAYSLANRYAKRPEDAEELGQVALLGLLRAIDRFDPHRGVQFSTFAWATLRGEIKRYYRNHSWALRVPRGLQERYLVVAAAVDELAHELGRSPTYAELATRTDLTTDEVAEAIEVRHG